jgi:excisionase family DNA binding protein
MMEVTVKTAAKLMCVSPDTIRRRIISGDLPARKVPAEHGVKYLVEMPRVDPLPERDKENQAELESQRKTILFLQTELESRRREVQELHVLLQQTQAMLPPAKGVSWWRRLLPRAKR